MPVYCLCCDYRAREGEADPFVQMHHLEAADHTDAIAQARGFAGNGPDAWLIGTRLLDAEGNVLWSLQREQD